MTKRNRREKDRRRDMNERMRRMWEAMESHARAMARKGSRRDVGLLARDMLRERMTEGSPVLSIDDLTREHARVHRLPLRQAVDEVESFARDAVRRLQKQWRLIHPVTHDGLTEAEGIDPDDRDAIRRCVPGTGDPHAGPTRGWRIAHEEQDPCYLAYVNQQLSSVNGGYRRTQEQVSAAVRVGILEGSPSFPAIPGSVGDDR